MMIPLVGIVEEEHAFAVNACWYYRTEGHDSGNDDWTIADEERELRELRARGKRIGRCQGRPYVICTDQEVLQFWRKVIALKKRSGGRG